ncbi:MAG: hypothetical protein JWP57_4274 [Spirosoma sp.]|nr:hypothetical protein [Spirosoma sp.]
MLKVHTYIKGGRITLWVIVVVVAHSFTNLSQAQFQINPAVSFIPSHQKNVNNWGASLSNRYFFNPHLATGINIRYSPDIRLLMLTGQIEYFFNTNHSLHPYVGVEAGLYQKYKLELSEANLSSLGIGLKVGFQYAVSSSFGLNFDISRHTAEPAYYRYREEALLVNAGVFFTLKGKK